MWKIKKEVLRTGNGLIGAVQALVIMMDIGIDNKIFRGFADKNPLFYEWFEEADETGKDKRSRKINKI